MSYEAAVLVAVAAITGTTFGWAAETLASLPPAPEQIVAAVLIAEAGGEPAGGMEAVMGVIEDRGLQLVGCNGWLDRACKACLAPGQFSCLNGVTPAQLVRRAKRHPRWKRALQVAKIGGWRHRVKGANHYHEASLDPKPAWADPSKITARIGRHIFYRL